jgi:hypothetical protein
MDNERFGRLLQSHMFGSTTVEEQGDLAEAALDSTERLVALAQADEIRVQLSDAAFRRELIDALPLVAPRPAPLWQRWFQWQVLVPLVGSAAVVFLALVVRDRMAGTEPTPDLVAVNGGDPGEQRPLGGPSGDAAALRALFELPASRAVALGVALPAGARYRRDDVASATLTLQQPSRVYAFARGPAGDVRQVYPQDREAAVTPAGAMSFTFQAGGPLDPERGGAVTLRVLVAPAAATGLPVGAARAVRWEWLGSVATFEDASYELLP